MMILVALMFLNSMNLIEISLEADIEKLEADIEKHYETAGLYGP